MFCCRRCRSSSSAATADADAWSRFPVGSSHSTSRGCADQRARDRHALLLAARQLARPMVDSIAEADLLDERARRRAGSSACARRRRHQRRDQNVLEHRALRQQAVVLKDEADLALRNSASAAGRARRIPAAERDGAGRRRLECAQDVEQRALAAAGRPDDCGRFTGGQRERDVGQDGQRTAGVEYALLTLETSSTASGHGRAERRLVLDQRARRRRAAGSRTARWCSGRARRRTRAPTACGAGFDPATAREAHRRACRDVGLDEQSAAGLLDDFRERAPARLHHRHAARHRFEQEHPLRFVVGGRHRQHVELAQERRAFRRGPRRRDSVNSSPGPPAGELAHLAQIGFVRRAKIARRLEPSAGAPIRAGSGRTRRPARAVPSPAPRARSSRP